MIGKSTAPQANIPTREYLICYFQHQESSRRWHQPLKLIFAPYSVLSSFTKTPLCGLRSQVELGNRPSQGENHKIIFHWLSSLTHFPIPCHTNKTHKTKAPLMLAQVKEQGKDKKQQLRGTPAHTNTAKNLCETTASNILKYALSSPTGHNKC